MILWTFAGVLFWIFLLPSRFHLLWVNYKGRFRYRLREHSSFWRRLDRRIGIGSLFVDFALSILIVVFLSAFLALLLDVPLDISSCFVLFGAIGWTFVNAATDDISVKSFERNCLKCDHKESCMRFHEQHCRVEPIKQRARSACLLAKKQIHSRCRVDTIALT